MMDFSGLAGALINALTAALPELLKAATDGLAILTTTISGTAWDAMVGSAQQSDWNFLTRTPPSMSYNLGGVADLAHQWEPALLGAGTLACVFGGIAAAGREYCGWSWGPGEWAARLFIGIALGMSAIRIYTMAIDANNRLLDAIVTAPLPNMPTPDIDPISAAVIAAMWVVLGFRLIVRMGYRLVYLDLLLVVGPIALVAWTLPGGQSYARFWIKSFVGLLLGQDLVALCLRLASVIGGPLGGSFAGLALGIAVLLLAYDMATIFAEIKGGGLSQVVRQTISVVRAVT